MNSFYGGNLSCGCYQLNPDYELASKISGNSGQAIQQQIGPRNALCLLKTLKTVDWKMC